MPKTKAISLDFVDGHKAEDEHTKWLVFQSVSKCQELEREVISRNSKTVTEYRTTLAEVGNKTSKTRKKSSERCD